MDEEMLDRLIRLVDVLEFAAARIEFADHAEDFWMWENELAPA